MRPSHFSAVLTAAAIQGSFSVTSRGNGGAPPRGRLSRPCGRLRAPGGRSRSRSRRGSRATRRSGACAPPRGTGPAGTRRACRRFRFAPGGAPPPPPNDDGRDVATAVLAVAAHRGTARSPHPPTKRCRERPRRRRSRRRRPPGRRGRRAPSSRSAGRRSRRPGARARGPRGLGVARGLRQDEVVAAEDRAGGLNREHLESGSAARSDPGSRPERVQVRRGHRAAEGDHSARLYKSAEATLSVATRGRGPRTPGGDGGRGTWTRPSGSRRTASTPSRSASHTPSRAASTGSCGRCRGCFVRGAAGRVLRDRGPQRVGQVDAAEDPRRRSTAPTAAGSVSAAGWPPSSSSASASTPSSPRARTSRSTAS